MFTCKDAKELQRRIHMNVSAIKTTVPIIIEAMLDLDEDFAIKETENLQSQATGLVRMLNEAKEKNVAHLVLDDQEW